MKRSRRAERESKGQCRARRRVVFALAFRCINRTKRTRLLAVCPWDTTASSSCFPSFSLQARRQLPATSQRRRRRNPLSVTKESPTQQKPPFIFGPVCDVNSLFCRPRGRDTFESPENRVTQRKKKYTLHANKNISI